MALAVDFLVPCHSPMDTKPIRRLYGLQLVFKSVRQRQRHIKCNLTGDFNRILYRYEKILLNIVEFCNSCWKTTKNAPFHIKSPEKNFMVGPKGGHRTVPPLKYATGWEADFSKRGWYQSSL